MSVRKAVAFGAFSCALIAFSTVSLADNWWGRYKWKPASIPFVLHLGDNVSDDWDGHLIIASVDWSVSESLSTEVVEGSTDSASCSPEAGNVQVCNDNYGDNGWLGLAQIYTRGPTIIAGLAKLNDYYHGAPPYNTTAWRQMVMCQEVAHTFGLDHQDEIFGNPNLGSCMDYTDDPEGSSNGMSNEHPNQHDYDQLKIIYPLGSDDSGGGGGGGGGNDGCNPRSPKCNPLPVAGEHPEWGRLVSGHGGIEIFERNLGGGNRVITSVTWTLENAAAHEH